MNMEAKHDLLDSQLFYFDPNVKIRVIGIKALITNETNSFCSSMKTTKTNTINLTI